MSEKKSPAVGTSTGKVEKNILPHVTANLNWFRFFQAELIGHQLEAGIIDQRQAVSDLRRLINEMEAQA